MQRKLAIILITFGVALPSPALSGPPPQEVPPLDDPEIQGILDSMPPEQRVGQLFLVSFDGPEASIDSDIGLLIREKRVGGVILKPSNDNFTDEADLLPQVLQLTNDLQALASDAPPVPEGGDPEEGPPPLEGPYIPLFVAIEQEGGAKMYWQVLSGTTPVPTNMAIGATWDETYAQEVGTITGQEIDALGINMLLGPSLDVLEETQPSTGNDIGVSSFGGDPFWVAQMSAAYVQGVHMGSSGRVAVVPKHFPGVGSADRPTDVEISTVRRSLSNLRQVDLAPFFAVTGASPTPDAQADGVLTAHIRYLGFQGLNPRVATRPISLDAQALQVLMAEPQITEWRVEGGLLVSGPLGQRSIRRFYDPSENTFPNRRIAQDAFLAGNDILYLGGFGAGASGDQTETQVVVDTIDFFVQKYSEDPTFQARVDEAVARILHQKLDQFRAFDLARAQRSEAGLEAIGQGREVTVQVSQAALTQLSPAQAELVGPADGDSFIVVFTDERQVAPCATCEPKPLVPFDALTTAVIQLYGPEGSGLVQPANLQRFSFTQLSDLLEFGPVLQEAPAAEELESTVTPEPNPVEVALDNADWIVFLMLDVDAEVPESDVVKRFLADRPDLASDVNIVVMAMDAPYFLDATEISKLSAYYGLYDSTSDAVTTAARALFQEVLPQGASPVSVGGINYEILTATSPDPGQVIEIYAGEVPPDSETPPAPLELVPGDTLQMRTGVILDHNRNPVPDGTPVEFNINFLNEGLQTSQDSITFEGVAQASLVLDRVGQIEIAAASEPAQLSFTLIADVKDDIVDLATRAPEVTPTVASPPTQETPVIAQGTPATPRPVAPQQPLPPEGVTLGDLFLSILGLLAISVLAYRFGLWQHSQVNSALFYALPSLLGGLLVYNYYALRLPGVNGPYEVLTVALAAWVGGLAGFILAFGVRWLFSQRALERSGGGGE